jgi:hypothetical protein
LERGCKRITELFSKLRRKWMERMETEERQEEMLEEMWLEEELRLTKYQCQLKRKWGKEVKAAGSFHQLLVNGKKVDECIRIALLEGDLLGRAVLKIERNEQKTRAKEN